MFAVILKKVIAAAIGASVGTGFSLLRDEVSTAKEEFSSKIRGLIGGAVFLAISIGLFVGAILMLLVAGIAALTLVWPTWLAILVVGGSLLLVSGILLAVGLAKIRNNRDLRPARAVNAARSAASFFRR